MHHLLDVFESTVARQPESSAACDQSLMLNYGQFRAVAMGLARQIAEQSRGPRVGILAPTSAAGAAAIFACWYAGKTPVPLNFLLAPEELVKILRDAEIDLLVTIDKFAPSAQKTGLPLLLLNGKTLVPGEVERPAAAASDVGVFLYTSGTSGAPKGVMLSFGNILGNAQAGIEHARITPDQVFCSVLPQFHSFGFTTMTVLPLTLGATVWYLPRFSPVGVVETIRERRVTIFMAIPSMYAAIANMKQADPEALASIKLAVSGGEPLPMSVFERMRERFGVTIYEGYGMTESSPCVTFNLPERHRPGSVGSALPGIDVYAVDEQGQRLAADQTGEIVMRGHCVMQGYHNQPELSAETVRDGALLSGDMGHVDADGFVHITGRKKEMIIVGGDNVFPGEIEAVLSTHPAVAECAVVGVSDEVRGELPVGFVILREGQTADANELRSFCRDRLAGFKVPRDVYLRDDLPRSATGKILKRELKP